MSDKASNVLPSSASSSDLPVRTQVANKPVALRVVDGQGLAIDVAAGERAVLKAKVGGRYRVLKKSGLEGVLADDVIGVRKGDELTLAYGDGTHVVFENFYTVCTSEEQCSVMLPSIEASGSPFVLAGTSEKQSFLSSDKPSLVYSHGNQEELQQVAKSLDASGGLQVPTAAQPDAFEAASSSDMGSVLVPVAIVGGVLLLAAALGGKHGGSDDPSTTTVQGTVVLGPVSSGHGLKVTLYRADGTVLVPESSVNADGSFSAVFSASYKGVVLARVRDTSTGVDYQDEVSGLKDLNTDLRAVFSVTGPGVVDVSITPLTELATRRLLNDTGGDANAGVQVGVSRLGSEVTAANSAIANAFGVSDVLKSASSVLSSGYNDSLVSDGQKYARALAKLAGLDAREGGVSNTLEVLKAQLTSGSLSAAGQALLADGAAIFESGSNATLASLIPSGVALGAVSASNVAAATLAKNAGELADNALNATEALGGTQIVVAVAGNAIAGDTVSVRLSGTGVGTEQTTSAYTLSAADVTRGYVSVEVSQAMLDASGEGMKVVSATYRNGSSTQDVVVDGFSYDVTAPTVSFQGLIAIDDRINLLESTTPSSLLISGSVEPGALLTLNIGGVAHTPIMGNGTWSYQLTPSDVSALGQGLKTLNLVATDAVGNTRSINKSILIDTEAPAVSFNVTAGNDTVDLTERASGVLVSGITTAEPGQIVSVTWGGITKTGSVNADHSWTVASFASNELPTSGVTTLAVDISDAAGNPAATVTKSVTIDPFLGGSGADIFYFSQNIGSTQTVTNFTRSQGDKIDLHTLLNGYGCTSANASNFLSLTQNATDAVLKIDLQGLANFSTPEHTFTMTGGWSNAGGLNDTLNNLLLDSVILI